MSCHECMYITGHSTQCSNYVEEVAYQVQEVDERIQALEARVAKLEEAVNALLGAR